jgi:predicted nuclease of predicted toxin-antitoxin system
VRLLLDQNLSPRLVRSLAELSEILHVRDVALQAADDQQVWDYAHEQGLMIVSKDSDFRQLSFRSRSPVKIIWIRLGNCSTAEIETVLRTYYEEIVAFESDPSAAVLALG